MKTFFASQNPNKIREISALMPAGIEISGIDDVTSTELEETGSTLEENALQKAEYVARRTGLPAFADDTGLEVEALHGAPGVMSARYAGEEKSAEANIRKLLSELAGISNRHAQFRTVIAYVNGNKHHLFEGKIAGKIIESPRGKEGFGYDPVFVPEGSDKTFAEMTLTEKNRFSHRARAVARFVEFLAHQ